MAEDSTTQSYAVTTGDAVIAQNAPTSFDCKMFSFVADGILMLLISAFGTVGNSLTVVVLWSKAKANSTSLLLLCLALVDTGVLVTYTIMVTSATFCSFTSNCGDYFTNLYVFLTAYFWPVASTLHLCSTWLTALVTFHRYVGVCHPHKYNTWTNIPKTRLQLAAIFFGSLLYNAPRFFDETVKLSEDGKRYFMQYTPLGSNKTFGYVYDVGLYYIIVYVIPFAALTFMVIQLIRAFEISKEKRRLMTRAKKDDNDLTFTLVIVVIVFMLCQVFNPIRRAIALAHPIPRNVCNPAWTFFSFLATLGIVLNSAVNFVIYCVCGKKFRRQMLRKVCGSNRVDDDSSVVTATGVTATDSMNQK